MAKSSKKQAQRLPPASPRIDHLASEDQGKPDRTTALLKALLIVAAGLWIYWPSLQGDWLWDDDVLVTQNATLRNLSGLGEIWFFPPGPDYWPLTSTLFWIEWHLWGAVPLGYRIVSLTLHVMSGLLIWRLLSRLGLRMAWLGGLLFVIHPLAVESVAWISETKNTLSLPLALLSLDFWIGHVEGKSRGGYARSLFFYLAAMLAKTSVIMLPAVLLLYVWWKRGRIARREIVETIPYFIIALALGIVTVLFQHAAANGTDALPARPLFERIGCAPVALLFYLGKFLLPTLLLPVYPAWKFDGDLLIQLAVPVVALAWGGWWVWRRGAQRQAALGLGFFALTLLPVAGLLNMKYLSISPVADHFIYLPMIGLIGLVVAALGIIDQQFSTAPRVYRTGAITFVAVLLAFQAHGYAAAYINEATLWGYAVEHNPQSWVAQDNLAKALLLSDQPHDAIVHFDEAVRLHPQAAQIHLNRGRTLVQLGRVQEGIDEFDQALKIDPTDPAIFNQKGVALMQSGRFAEALAQFEEALKLRPDYAVALENEGAALAQSGRVPEAIDRFTAALKVSPGDVATLDNLGSALLQSGRSVEALARFEQALELDPSDARARQNVEKLRSSVNP